MKTLALVTRLIRRIPPFEKGGRGGIFLSAQGANPPQSPFFKGGKISKFRSAAATCAIATILQTNAIHAQHVHTPPPSVAPTIGSAAVPFELKTLDGKAAGLETFRGKPLVLNFFASWCDPCREEMPQLNEMAASAAGRYHLFGVAVEDTRAAMTEFVNEAKITFPVALDPNSTVKRRYRIFGPPATFFIDSQGVIRDVVLGPLTAERAKQALKKVGASR
ncbi:MAG: TlpA family protein disulfide reductase [Deltaproteobacteria bacterium]|nr:TlpA family protein disulfide reductase [Deltaproteobacteria bacterium]